MEKIATVLIITFCLLSVGEGAVCRRGDCDLYEVPSGKDRVCRMPADSSIVEWYVGTLESAPKCSLGGFSRVLSIWDDFCPGYVGMNMSLWCDSAVVTGPVIFKDGIPLSGNATVTFNYLRKEDEGLYQCRRNDSGEVLGEFNMTVRGKPFFYCLHAASPQLTC